MTDMPPPEERRKTFEETVKGCPPLKDDKGGTVYVLTGKNEQGHRMAATWMEEHQDTGLMYISEEFYQKLLKINNMKEAPRN